MARHTDCCPAPAKSGRSLSALSFATSVGLLLLILSGCAPTEPAEGALLAPDGTAIYSDGTYVAHFSHTGREGWQPYIEIRVRAGLIETVCFGAVGRDEVRVRADESYGEHFRMETGTVLHSYLDGLGSALISRQQLPVSVPATALDGRVYWSNAFLVLAIEALELARGGETGPVRIPSPGSYVRVDRPDELGWDARLAVVFDGTGPVALSLQERRVDSSGETSLKSADSDYTEAYERVLGLTPGAVLADLSVRLLQADSSEDSSFVHLDAVSGATGTTDRFVILMNQILSSREALELPGKLCTD